MSSSLYTNLTVYFTLLIQCFIINAGIFCYNLNVLTTVYPIFIAVMSIIFGILMHHTSKQIREENIAKAKNVSNTNDYVVHPSINDQFIA